MSTEKKEIPASWPVYRIIRFRYRGKPRTVKSRVTLAEAQAHCSLPSTRLPGVFFDGYDRMAGY